VSWRQKKQQPLSAGHHQSLYAIAPPTLRDRPGEVLRLTAQRAMTPEGGGVRAFRRPLAFSIPKKQGTIVPTDIARVEMYGMTDELVARVADYIEEQHRIKGINAKRARRFVRRRYRN
jgi:hypothetical protein